MTARKSMRLRRPRAARREDFAFECLTRLARILVRCGISPKDLVKDLREICRTLSEPSKPWDPTRLAFLVDVPHVIALWHSDPAYLGSGGQPTALPLRGSGPSLAGLIERVLPREDPSSVARALVRMRGLRRQGGRYLPTGRHLAYRQDTARLHSLHALMGMLRTVERNVTGARNAAIFERSAVNPDFPVAALPAFHRRVRSRASGLLWDFDGYMRRRERDFSRGPRTRVGVEIFAFEEPYGAGAGNGGLSPPARGKTRARRKRRGGRGRRS
jgi:hypothetical protein